MSNEKAKVLFTEPSRTEDDEKMDVNVNVNNHNNDHKLGLNMPSLFNDNFDQNRSSNSPFSSSGSAAKMAKMSGLDVNDAHVTHANDPILSSSSSFLSPVAMELDEDENGFNNLNIPSKEKHDMEMETYRSYNLSAFDSNHISSSPMIGSLHDQESNIALNSSSNPSSMLLDVNVSTKELEAMVITSSPDSLLISDAHMNDNGHSGQRDSFLTDHNHDLDSLKTDSELSVQVLTDVATGSSRDPFLTPNPKK